MKWPRSPFERFEEWLFKIRRRSPSAVFKAMIQETREFKKLVEATECPTCKTKLMLAKFERGPKGWEADIKCEGCNYTQVVSSLCSVGLRLSSKGKARE